MPYVTVSSVIFSGHSIEASPKFNIQTKGISGFLDRSAPLPAFFAL